MHVDLGAARARALRHPRQHVDLADPDDLAARDGDGDAGIEIRDRGAAGAGEEIAPAGAAGPIEVAGRQDRRRGRRGKAAEDGFMAASLRT